MRRICLGLMMTVQLGGSATAASADDRPALSVLPYQAAKGALSADEAAELADDLAARLVESGRFRLLPHHWLPGPSPADRPAQSVQAARTAAREAGVEYLVVVSVQGLASRSSGPPAIVRIGAALLGWRGRAQLSRPCPPVRPRRSTVIVELDLVSVTSGETVRTSLGRVQMTLASAMRSASTGCGLASVGSGSSASPTLDLDGLKRANADLARGLTIPPGLRAR
jgi:hypothetical protein